MRIQYLIPLFILLTSCNDCNKLWFRDCPSPTPSGKSGEFTMTLYDQSVDPAERRVSILFQVLNLEGKGVDDLVDTDLDIIEGEGKVNDTEANVTIDPSAIPKQIRTVLLMDISSSVSAQIAQIRDAAISLVSGKLPEQEFAIYTFDSDLYLLQDFTANLETLKNSINSIPSTNLVNSTNLYGAIIDLTENRGLDWSEQQDIDQIVSKQVIVFTDGRHNADPGLTIDNALAAVGDKKFYVAALKSTDLNEPPLQEIANQGYFLASNIGELKNKFLAVQNDIKKYAGSTYYLYYTSPITNGTPRSNYLEVKIRNNKYLGDGSSIITSFNSAGFGD